MNDYRIPEPEPPEDNRGRWQAEYEQWLEEQDSFPKVRDEDFDNQH